MGAVITVLVVMGADGFVDGTTISSGSEISGATAGALDLGVEPRISDNATDVDFNSSRK